MARVYGFENQSRQDTSIPADGTEALPISRQMQVQKAKAPAQSAMRKLDRGARGEIFGEPEIEEMGSKTKWARNDGSSENLGEERRRNVNGDEEIKDRQNMEEKTEQYNAERQEETEKHNEKDEEEENKIISLSFWEQWLGFLSYFYLWVKTEGSFEYTRGPRFPLAANNYEDTVPRLWHTTELLLLNGADVNLRMTSLWPTLWSSHYCPLRQDRVPVFTTYRWCLVVDCAAMFWLDTCFDDIPEFQDFSKATQTTSSKPWRKLIGVAHAEEPMSCWKAKYLAHFNEQDEEMLWSLIDRYENSSTTRDAEGKGARGLFEAIKQIWARQYPEMYAQVPHDEKVPFISDEERVEMTRTRNQTPRTYRVE